MMKYIVLIALICLLLPAVSCLQCYSNTTNTGPPEVIECQDDYCLIIALLSGSGDTLTYVEIEGCGTFLSEEQTIKPFNLTCENGTQSGNITILGTPFYGILYCCDTDKCNSEIPGFTPPPKPSTTTTTTTLPPSTVSQTNNPSSTTTSNDGISVTPVGSFLLFITIITMFFK